MKQCKVNIKEQVSEVEALEKGKKPKATTESLR